MSDEPNQPIVDEEVVADEPQTPEPEAKEEPEEQVELATGKVPDEAEEAPAEPEPEETPAEAPPSRREQLRIQTLLQKYPDLQKRVQPTSQAPSQPDRMDYGQALDADPAVIQQLEADRQREGTAQYNAGLEQAKVIQFHTRLEIDDPQVRGKYKFLDNSDKENFDPIRADAMNQLYILQTGYDPGDSQRGIPESVQNPNIRYRDFVEAQMEFAEALMADRQTQTVKNVAKQSAQTGLRPDGSSAKRLNLNQPPEKMTMEELYASIGQTPPKK